jgi:hypothetical protein
VWQALRSALHPKGFELVTVGLDTQGNDGCAAFIEAAQPQHPSLIDRYHRLADLFGVVNIPSAIWIDEQGMIVRPAETAPAPPQPNAAPPSFELPPDMPEHFVAMMGEAAKITQDPESYHAALRDWVDNGPQSPFALSPDQVLARSRPRNQDIARGHAHFELACQLEIDGNHEAAVTHFRHAHELVPDSWTFRRQAWSLEPVGAGPMARFWQGPNPEDPSAWPYRGDWITDIKRSGAENYNDPWAP